MIKTPGGAQRRRLVRDHRPEDLHFGRRARSRGEHRPSRARAHRGRAGGREGHLAVRRAEISRQRRRLARRAQRASSCGSLEHKMGIHGNATCVMNYDGAKGWLVGEENRGLNAMFVMMNGARLGVAVQGLVAVRGRLSERRGLREGAAAGALADRREGARQARRSDHRASRRAPHAARDPSVQRGGARADDLGRARRGRGAGIRPIRKRARRPTIASG